MKWANTAAAAFKKPGFLKQRIGPLVSVKIAGFIPQPLHESRTRRMWGEVQIPSPFCGSSQYFKEFNNAKISDSQIQQKRVSAAKMIQVIRKMRTQMESTPGIKIKCLIILPSLKQFGEKTHRVSGSNKHFVCENEANSKHFKRLQKKNTDWHYSKGRHWTFQHLMECRLTAGFLQAAL